jgi:hypothetical protein
MAWEPTVSGAGPIVVQDEALSAILLPTLVLVETDGWLNCGDKGGFGSGCLTRGAAPAGGRGIR